MCLHVLKNVDVMMEWTDDQLRAFLMSIRFIDGGCSDCIRECIEEFLDLTSWDLLERLDAIGPTIDWAGNDSWSCIRPEYIA